MSARASGGAGAWLSSWASSVASGLTLAAVLYVANTISQVHTDVAVLSSKVQDHSQAIADMQQQMRQLIAHNP